MHNIVLAADHNGIELKEKIKDYLIKTSIFNPIDIGPFDTGKVDYPDYAHQASIIVASNDVQLGILICGSGIGMDMAANKHKNVRAALCYNVKSTKLSREHNNANVMALGARLIKKNIALKCVSTFMKTNFKGGHHLRRVKKI